MLLGGDPVGRRGLTLLTVAGVVGVILAFHGWAGHGSGVVPVSAPIGSGAAASTSAAGTPTAASPGPSASPSAPSSQATAPVSSSASPSASTGPLLSAESYASYSFQVWPGTLSAAAKQAQTGLTVSVHRQGSGLSVAAGATGQPPAAPHVYPTGARVYVVEASLGDDSGDSDYSLGDDGLVVTDSAGRIVG
jgi:hypothetical protein